MTSNDPQIDVLLRRYAGQSHSQTAAEHLDADELNAFAEGSLPAAARARYVSHLIDCDNCRQIVSQLAISSGALIKNEAEATGGIQRYSWWKRLFSPLTLRYAAFAMVLIAAAGVIFLVTRRPRDSNLVAQSGERERVPETAVKPQGAAPQTNTGAQSRENENNQPFKASPSQTSPSSDEIAKAGQLKAGDNPASPPKSLKEGEAPLIASAKKAEPMVSQPVPSYAPPPPLEGQRAETPSREQSGTGSLASASGPRKSASPTDDFKMMDRARVATETDKDNRAGSDSSRAVNQPARKRASDEKAKGPRRDVENNVVNRNSSDVQSGAVNTQGAVTLNRAATATEEKPPETRSAGGRKFRRQGNAWVDARFKSSMSVKSIARGSSEFASLDSGLRSIAQQLGGEVIVVWKGKAYLIR
ncbi:MAG TPA: hypothetical protein VN956_20400 [Pyrinomonadaceae bacterium]|nr:hypothetical protein [Pyrinomonadaceae bacterium]